MIKYLVQIKFRYTDIVGGDERYREDVVTVGVYDTADEAYTKGNEALEVFEQNFPLNPNYMRKDRFSATGGCFGYPEHLISNLAYLTTPFSFYASVEPLKIEPVQEKIDAVMAAVKRYKDYQAQESDESY